MLMVDVLVDEKGQYWISPEGVAQIVKSMLAHIEQVEIERDNTRLGEEMGGYDPVDKEKKA
jgi:hypothetical protein